MQAAHLPVLVVRALANLALKIHPVEPTARAARDAVDTGLDFADLVTARPVERYASLHARRGFWGRQGFSFRGLVHIVILLRKGYFYNYMLNLEAKFRRLYPAFSERGSRFWPYCIMIEAGSGGQLCPGWQSRVRFPPW